MKIGLLGGTFDPPHILHRLAAEEARRVLGLDFVALNPTHDTKYYGSESEKKPTAPALRLAMTRKIEIPGIVTWDTDIRHRLDGQTRHTIEHLEPGHEYVFILGSDQDVGRWPEYEKVLEFMDFWIIPRYPLEKYPIRIIHPRMHVLRDTPLVDFEIDSTAIREHLRSGYPVDQIVEPSGKPLRDLLHPRVLEYALEHNVYGEGRQTFKEIR